MDSWQTRAGFVLPSSPGSSAGQSCVGPAAGWPGEANYSCAIWLLAPSHQSVSGEQRQAVSGQGRCSSTLKGWCQCTAPLTGRGLRRASAGKKQCPAKSKWCACPTGLLAPVGSACPCPQPLPSACDATSSLSQAVSAPLLCSALCDQGCHHCRDFVAGPGGCLYLFLPSCDPSFDPPLVLLIFLWLC